MRTVLAFIALASCTPIARTERDANVSAAGDVRPPIVRGIDHFFATSPDPEKLYHFFRDTLGLPEVYPFRNYGDFTSGVVSVGNVLFEVVTWSVPDGERLPTELKGIAFEPSDRLPVTVVRLAEYGVAFQKPDSVMFTDSSGARVLAYVNVPLDGPGGLPPQTASIFINDNLGSVRAAARRRAGAEELTRRNGGALGASWPPGECSPSEMAGSSSSPRRWRVSTSVLWSDSRRPTETT